jgi:hypothetical protein
MTLHLVVFVPAVSDDATHRLSPNEKKSCVNRFIVGLLVDGCKGFNTVYLGRSALVGMEYVGFQNSNTE